MSSPEIIVVDQPAVSVTVSGPTISVASETVDERIVEVEIPTYAVTVTEQVTTVVVGDVVVAGSGGNSYFPSGW